MLSGHPASLTSASDPDWFRRGSCGPQSLSSEAVAPSESAAGQSSHPPSVDQLATSIASSGLPHPLRVEVARAAIADDEIDTIERRARARARQMLTPVINATGVLLHTNLGRAPLAHHQDASFFNLELDLATGKRGSRQLAVGSLIASAVGAEAAIVVNNCASAVLLALAALPEGRGVAVSRGELVEIGGGFRVPDVMAQSGARLVEVGTTNRTRFDDFDKAVKNDDVGLALHVHQSNYRIIGFTEAVSIRELATLDVPVLADIGSGLLDAACPWIDGPPPPWLAGEPAARQSLADGAAMVMFSGDKLMGGPQCGILAGSRELIDQCAKHPLARAVRPGGLVLSALQTTMLHYLQRDGAAIPFWRQATLSVEELRTRAKAVAESVSGNSVSGTDSLSSNNTGPRVIDTMAVPGGGTLPGVEIPSVGLRLDGDQSRSLRFEERPIMARVENGTTILDLRTVDPADDIALVKALRTS